MQISDALALPGREQENDQKEVCIQLLCSVLGQEPAYLFTWPERALSHEEESRFQALYERYVAGEALAYLTGSRGFWSFDLEVDESTLIPRPDTELLVELALERVDAESARVLDLGTGTGAIALALAVERPNWRVLASDRVADAVALARRNRERLGVSNLELVCGHWFEPISSRFDLIVSNPPYIAEGDPHLQQVDLQQEPSSALVAGSDGLSDLHQIIREAPQHLNPKGWLLLEHGYDQAERVQSALQEFGFIDLFSQQDLGGNPRVSGGQWLGE